MTLGYYYAPVFRVVGVVLYEHGPKRRQKKSFKVSYEGKTTIAHPEDIRAGAEEVVDRAKIRRKHRRMALLLLLEEE